MKARIQFIFLSVWTAVVMFSLPLCIGSIYMDITGNSKGYDYNLGSETNIWIMMGIIELIIWGVLAIPSTVTICKKITCINKKYLILMGALMIFFFVGGICFMGGWHEFTRCFGVA